MMKTAKTTENHNKVQPELYLVIFWENSNIDINKNICIDGFRSAFVSHYYPTLNNKLKEIMKITPIQRLLLYQETLPH